MNEESKHIGNNIIQFGFGMLIGVKYLSIFFIVLILLGLLFFITKSYIFMIIYKLFIISVSIPIIVMLFGLLVSLFEKSNYRRKLIYEKNRLEFEERILKAVKEEIKNARRR